MQAHASEKHQSALYRKVDLFIKRINPTNGSEETTQLFYDIIDSIVEETREIERRKSDRSELREVIQEMRNGFALMEKRFEAMDKRFEDMQSYMDKRFEAVDKRFEDMQSYMDRRFEAVDKRFEDMQSYMDKRFEAVNKRFEDMDKRFTLMQWTMGIGFTMLTVFIAVLKVFAK
ncbi:MAG: hypothetical protein LDLANPLL_00330 [Turneriella sp.]|nr:hypothetical protein [Turneriella sp.]